MIVDLEPWKAELDSKAAELQSMILIYERLPDEIGSINKREQINFELEKPLFYSALAVRRIFETHYYTMGCAPNRTEKRARCLPEKLLSKNIRFQIGGQGDEKKTVSYKELASQIIHSALITWEEVDGVFRGFWLASERYETVCKTFVPWEKYICILREIANAPARKVV